MRQSPVRPGEEGRGIVPSPPFLPRRGSCVYRNPVQSRSPSDTIHAVLPPKKKRWDSNHEAQPTTGPIGYCGSAAIARAAGTGYPAALDPHLGPGRLWKEHACGAVAGSRFPAGSVDLPGRGRKRCPHLPGYVVAAVRRIEPNACQRIHDLLEAAQFPPSDMLASSLPTTWKRSAGRFCWCSTIFTW